MYLYVHVNMYLNFNISFINQHSVSGNFAVLAALLEAGCLANSPDIHGVYPLHYAVNESREPGEGNRRKREEKERE